MCYTYGKGTWYLMKKTLFFTILLVAVAAYLQNQDKNKNSPIAQAPEVVASATPSTETKPLPSLKKFERANPVVLPQKTIVARKTVKFPQLTEEFVPFDEEGNRY